MLDGVVLHSSNDRTRLAGRQLFPFLWQLANGVEGLLKYACKLGDLPEGDRKYSVSKEELKAAYDASDPELQACGACIVHACARDAERLAPAPGTACVCTGSPPARGRAGAQVRRDAARLRR